MMTTGRRAHQFTMGDRLRKAREAAGYSSQTEFAEATGISRATISAYELGNTTPRRGYLSIWSNVTDTDLNWILTGEASQSAESAEPEAEDNDRRDYPQESDTSSEETNLHDKPSPREGPQTGWGPLA